MAATSDRGSHADPAAAADAAAHAAARYVLPVPSKPANLIVDPEGRGPAAGTPSDTTGLRDLVLAGQAEARAGVAERFLDLLECQERFLAELRQSLGELGEAVHGDSRVRLLRHCHTLGEILDWAETVQADLRREAEQAREGRCPSDVAVLLREIAAEIEAEDPAVRIQVAETSAKTLTWAEPRLVRRGLRSAVLAVLERGSGGVAAEVGHEAGRVRLHLLGLGEPKPLQDKGLVEEVRDLLGVRHGAVLQPGPSGSGGTGLVILLPGL